MPTTGNYTSRWFSDRMTVSVRCSAYSTDHIVVSSHSLPPGVSTRAPHNRRWSFLRHLVAALSPFRIRVTRLVLPEPQSPYSAMVIRVSHR